MQFSRRRLICALSAVPLFATLHAKAQIATAMNLLFQQSRYLPRWQELLSTPAGANGQLAQFASFLGEESLAFAEAASLSTESTVLPVDASARKATAEIERLARDRRIVILNEAHTASCHRHFLSTLLPSLRGLGFTHLAAEAFSNSEAGLLIQNYRAGSPLHGAYGFYLWDPTFAEAIRVAAADGWKLVPYEARRDQRRSTATDSASRIAEREQIQAENLAAVMKADPSARLLIYVGHSHVRETPDERGNIWMAARLAELIGENPLTIDQSRTNYLASLGSADTLGRQVLERFRPDEPIVVLADGRSVGAEQRGADLAVFHPRYPPVNGRPGWLARSKNRRAVSISTGGGEGLRLLQARRSEEGANSVPADQFLLPAHADTGVLYLRSGAYTVGLETPEGFAELRRLTV